LESARLGLETGVRDVSDVLQATTQLLQNQTTWAAQKQNVENSLTTLLTDMGLPANIDIAMQALPDELPQTDVVPDLETLIAIGLQNRPDLLASEANLRSKQQSLIAAERQWLPQLNYNFDIGRANFQKGFHDKYNFNSTFQVSMPLFSGFYYRNAIRIAKANKKVAEEQLKQNQLSVIKEITTYHYSIKIAFETLQFATSFLAAAQEEYIVALRQYKQGTNTILDVISAQSSLADARARQANAFQQWYLSLANLAYSTGLISPTSLAPFNQSYEAPVYEE
jgi:outer membrane protein TolC